MNNRIYEVADKLIEKELIGGFGMSGGSAEEDMCAKLVNPGEK